MTLIILFLLTITAIYLLAKHKHRASIYLALVTIVFFFATGMGLIPDLLLKNLQSDYLLNSAISWNNNNAIIILGAGTTRVGNTKELEADIFSYGRIAKAIALYDDCHKVSQICKVVISGGDARHLGNSEASVYSSFLKTTHIKTEDLILESKSMNTWQNAQFTSEVLKTNHFDKVVLLSSGIHLRRSMLYFSHFGIEAVPIRADYVSAWSTIVPLALNFAMTDFALHEYIGILRYNLYNRLGLNVTASRPGSL